MKNEQEIWEALRALKEDYGKSSDEKDKTEFTGAIIALKWVLEKLSAVELNLSKEAP